MGMFDQVECQCPLPVLGVVEGAAWQSKDLWCEMATIVITPTGRLTILGGVFACEPAARDLNYHGDFNFYSDRDGEWFEFIARFTEGQLSRIWRVTGNAIADEQRLQVVYHGNQPLSEASPSTQSEAIKAHSQSSPPVSPETPKEPRLMTRQRNADDMGMP